LCAHATDQEATDMTDAFAPAIAALQNELRSLEAKIRETKGAINVLCRHAGMAELYQNIEQEIGGAAIATIKADTFYGKTIGTAAREYLDMRKASGLGPATAKDIFDALKKGGLQFDTANDTNAQISLGNTLRKNSRIFHRLPNGQYGLLAWYPNAKASNDKSAASTEPTADEASSSDAPNTDQDDGASEPLAKGGSDDLATNP